MMRKTAMVTGVALVVAFCVAALRYEPAPPGFTPPPAAQVRTAAPSFALFFGDSYFNGAAGVTSGQTLASVAGNQLGYSVFIRGHGGTGFTATDRVTRTAPYPEQIRQGAAGGLDPHLLRLVVLEGGLNDVANLSAADETAAAVDAAIRLHRMFPRARLVLVGPIAPTGTVTPNQQRVVSELSQAAQVVSVPFIDASSWITPDNVKQIIGPDGTHPTTEGHRILAGKLVAALRRAGVS